MSTHPIRFLGCILLLLVTSQVAGSSIRAVTLGEMLEQSELVFEGRVTGHEVGDNSESERILFTYVRFEVLDVIKGDYDKDVISLLYLGGSKGGRTLRVTDLHVPRVGEKGIYFVGSINQNRVHPLYGWEQGHFLVQPDLRQGVEIVRTRSEKPVYGIESARQIAATAIEISNGVARGIRLEPTSVDEQALSAARFKRLLRALLQSEP